MPANYSAAVRSASLTAAGNLADLRTVATDRIFLREVGVSMGVAGAAPTIALSRAGTVGTASTSAAGQAEDPGDPAASGVVGSAWSVAPVAAAVLMRRVTLPASVGAGRIWSWAPGDELVVPVSSSVLVSMPAISAAAATAVDVYFRWTE